LREEREEMHKFISEQLRKGYIRLSKSPQMAPMLFIEKKNSKKQMVQNYRYLNEWTVKNNYPLPLILNIVEDIGIKKVFTTLERLFKPTVMFFGLTNSLATFQTMMNKILQNLINTGKMASFIDDVIVGTKTKEGHDEVVEEVVRRLAENNLYIKPEKYK